ncbi:YodL [uncultured virus]|nr:YodL [uncultured virus]
MAFTIYQLKREHVEKSIECYLENYQPKSAFYEKIYTGSTDILGASIDEILDHIFVKFNSDSFPKDYQGRSLSVSDIVELKGTFYVCEPWGWNKVSF